MYEHILDALRRGATEEGLTAAHEAAASQPDDAQAHRLLAVAQQQAGDRLPALASIERALALAPEDAELHLLRAGLLLGERQLDEAQAALARSIGLDPNQFPAYVLQAQLALGRGDLDDAERLARAAARIAPGHPQLQAIEGTLALRRGDPDRALAILTQAAEQSPHEPQLRLALAFAYLAKGHLAFAEQAFRGLLEQDPGSQSLRMLLAELLLAQGRPGDAADELAPLLDRPETTPALKRLVGELELASGRPERALPSLRAAFAAAPQDRRTLFALLETWRRLGDIEDARHSLEAALATHPELPDLWQARLALEPPRSAETRTLVERWLGFAPESLPALEAMAGVHEQFGEAGAAEAIARRIVALEPGRGSGELRILGALLERDPAACIDYIADLRTRSETQDSRQLLQQWLGVAQDRAGRHAEAAQTWSGLNRDVAGQRLPLPPVSAPRSDWPELAPVAQQTAAIAFLVGLPGSGVERLAALLSGTVQAFRADRFGPNPPADLLQNYRTIPGLQAGEIQPAAVIDSWRAALPARGLADGEAIDWLLWWDNLLLAALRPHLPQALLVIAIRDPRDMLLDWLAFGAPAPFAIQSPQIAAHWMAQLLAHLASLHEQDLFPHRLLRLDESIDAPQALADALAAALDTPLPAAPAALAPKHFAPGHWRAYAQVLAEPFALLTPVARRLGYPEA